MEESGILPEEMRRSNEVVSFHRELAEKTDFEPSAGVEKKLRRVKELQKMGAAALGRPKNNQPGMFEDLQRRQVVVQHQYGN